MLQTAPESAAPKTDSAELVENQFSAGDAASTDADAADIVEGLIERSRRLTATSGTQRRPRSGAPARPAPALSYGFNFEKKNE